MSTARRAGTEWGQGPPRVPAAGLRVADPAWNDTIMGGMNETNEGAATPDRSPVASSIVTRMADGDASALAALYDEHASLVFSLAARIVEDQSEAEAVVEEVFGLDDEVDEAKPFCF